MDVEPSRVTERSASRTGIVIPLTLLLVISIAASFWAAKSDVLDNGPLLESTGYRSQTLSAEFTGGVEDAVDTRELSERLKEVFGILSKDALFSYDPVDIDAIIKSESVKQEDTDAATASSIKELLATSGDQYAQYFSAEEYERYMQSSSGEYAGIGVSLVDNADGSAVVTNVVQDSPAEEAGVEVGSVIVAIDGERATWSADAAVTAIRRPEGETVEIVWLRDDTEFSTTMELRALVSPNVSSKLIGSVGYIYLRQFNAHTTDAVAEAIEELGAQGAEGYVLDLRDNPGGYLTQAVGLTSLFVKSGTVVEIETNNGSQREEVNGDSICDDPLVVLINGQSASASELVTAALKDHGRATIVGTTTYGKGTVQNIKEFSFGGAIKYTIAHYLSPDGMTIDGVGVQPDIEVEMGTGDNSVRFNGTGDYTVGADTQLDAALEEVYALMDTARSRAA